MSDSLLNILKFALLALLYLFFARVLWAVWSEVRGPRKGAPVQAHAVAVAPPPLASARAPRGRAAKAKRGSVTRLVVLEPKASRGTAISLANEVTFGRAPGCTVSVPDDTFVSQVHARVFVDNGTAIVEDVGSTNGTYVNAQRITQALPLNPGDRIQIGSTVLEAN
jgi:pSer/pThr/pTyr-binding forkhead associated (FHA) protein